MWTLVHFSFGKFTHLKFDILSNIRCGRCAHRMHINSWTDLFINLFMCHRYRHQHRHGIGTILLKKSSACVGLFFIIIKWNGTVLRIAHTGMSTQNPEWNEIIIIFPYAKQRGQWRVMALEETRINKCVVLHFCFLFHFLVLCHLPCALVVVFINTIFSIRLDVIPSSFFPAFFRLEF